jgi:hypothetical protein
MHSRLFALPTAMLLVLAAASAIAVPTASAQTVELNPGYIGGSIGIEGYPIGTAYVNASGAQGNASTSTSTGSYLLTVNVPQGGSADYTVYAYGYHATGYLTFPAQTVTVNDGVTTPLDFVLDPPGTLNATLTVTSGTLSYFYVYWNGTGTSGYSNVYGTSNVQPVFPGSLSVYGYAYFTDGSYVFLDYQYPDVAAGGTADVAWTVSQPVVTPGTIAGNASIIGPDTPDQIYVYASGPSYQSAGLTANGPYTLSPLNPGSYYMYAYAYYDSFTTYFYVPDAGFSPNRNPTVSGGATSTVDIAATTARVTGTLTLTGTKSLAQTSSAQISANGVYPTGSYGSSGGTSPNRQTGAYRLVLPAGDWTVPSQLYLQFNDPDPSYLNEYLYFYDYQAGTVTLAEGGSATRNLSYGTGTVTVTFRVVGGGTLSYPQLYGSCYRYGPGGSPLLWQYQFYSYGNQANVTEAPVTFIGMQGHCALSAYAQVGSSTTSFGQVEVDVVPGSTQVIDIGGPSLTVTFPSPDSITTNATITVTGTATDDVAVDTVVVNGVTATLTPPGPAASVGFSADIPLILGPNTVTTTATDTSGKIGSDTRTVYRDNGPPVVAFTPAAGSSTTNPSATVAGTATDDAGIESVSVYLNGSLVTTISGGGATSVPFSVPVTLVMGGNFIEVVATDISTYVTPENHLVTLSTAPSDTTPPVIVPTVTPGPNGAGWNKTDVAVSWSVTDPESGIASSTGCGPTTLTTETAGTMLTCSATNGAGLSASASVTVKIDKTGPTVTTGRTPAANGAGWNNTDVTVTFAATDSLSGVVGATTASETVTTEGAGQSVTRTFTDVAGNSTTATVSGINIDKTPPVISGLPANGCTIWPPNHQMVTVASISVAGGGSPVGLPAVQVTSNEPINGQGDGNTAPDYIVNGGSVQVRAERSGTGTGRTYTISVSVTDAAGNQATATGSCTVPHDQRKK